MSTQHTPGLGLVVPPENPTAEPEFTAMLRSRMNLFTSRFPVTPGMGLRSMLEKYNDVLPGVLGGFGRLRLDAAVVACSASHYLLSPAGDAAFCAELSEQACFPVASSPRAILAACAALGVERLALVSPYESWLTDTSRDYWREAGLAVDDVLRVRAGDHYDPYDVTTEQLVEQVRAHRFPEGSTILFTGTGMYTLDAFDALRGSHVLLSSNLAAVWWALRTGGALEGEPDDRAVMARLASDRYRLDRGVTPGPGVA